MFRVGDRAKAGGLAAYEKLTLVRAVRMNAGEQLYQRRFARAVLAAQRVDFTFPQIEAHVFERDDAGEFFNYILRFENNRAHRV